MTTEHRISFEKRDTGFEPVTTCLESKRSTPELIPQK
jgi:hypothetical protein